MRLLIAEDDSRLLKSLKHIFQSNGYIVDAVSNGNDALDFALCCSYDGFVFDIMMPGLDGVCVLKKIRQSGITAPALFLTAKTEPIQQVEGLDAGADDYLCKPFSVEVLLARVRAMLRRRDSFTPDLCTFAGLSLNRSTYEIQYENKKAALSGREFQIVEMLMERPNFIVTIDELMSHVWGFDSDVDISVVWVHISNIRKKLASMNANTEIRFIRGAGYKLEEKS